MKNFTEHKIDHDFSNTRIDRWFRQYFEGLSHNNLEKYLRKGFIRVNEKKIRSSYRLNKGDIIKTSVFITFILSSFLISLHISITLFLIIELKSI